LGFIWDFDFWILKFLFFFPRLRFLLIIPYYIFPEGLFLQAKSWKKNRYLINDISSIKASYTRSKQYQHLISNSSVGLPTDIWLPSDKYIKPQSSDQYAIGYFRNFSKNIFETSVEFYYKSMHDVIDYKDNTDLFLNSQIETQVLSGNGQSYGTEIFIKKNEGKITGWISYTLSKTTKQIYGINNNNPYPVKYDKRHNLSTVISYNFNTSWSISSTFKYSSGGYITIPEGTFNYYGASFNYYTKRNGYKLPPYHRLDISANYMNRKNDTRKWKTEWNFGIYNLYGRKNLFTLFIKQDVADLDASKAYKMYLYCKQKSNFPKFLQLGFPRFLKEQWQKI